jgi:endoplasmic reticulum Man9GlcNAc2 1,2-alpha-mannosidase
MVHLSESPSDRNLYLSRAVDLGDRLLTAFEDTASGLPYPSVNLATSSTGRKGKGVPDSSSPKRISTAEATTLQLEFKYLTYLTGNRAYVEKADKAMQVVRHAVNKRPGGSKLVPIFME